MISYLFFHDCSLKVINHNGGIWFSSKDIASALGYSKTNAITKMYNQNTEEFTAGMTEILESTSANSDIPVSGTSVNLKVRSRIFSLRGTHLIAMFARTAVAKEFRRWVLDILDNEVGLPQQSHSQLFPWDADLYVRIKEGKTVSVQIAQEGECFMSFPTFKEIAERAGYLVVHSEDLKSMRIEDIFKLGDSAGKTAKINDRRTA